jgi:hypothetical protein
VRNSEKGAVVAAEYPKVRMVYGGLDDGKVLEEEGGKADVVIREFHLFYVTPFVVSFHFISIRGCPL